ncbi:MAG: type III-B CRISPR module-associated protein Cmr5 [Polyangiaceae bacterium]|jgi:CRISPR-associated protein Cmr5|nr:type III-B CRISPR module-associated protein Cmr5 [Polyangiaceae bacterium]
MSGRDRAAVEPPKTRLVTRDQHFALHAYASVALVKNEARESYKIAVHDFGTYLVRGGLAAAMAALERSKGAGARCLLGHLADAGLVGLAKANADELPARVRALGLDAYVMASRESLHLTLWLKRAVQASAVEVSGPANEAADAH